MIQERHRVILAFVIVSTVWGSTWLAIKIGLTSVPPFFAAGLRFALSALILYAIVRVQGIEVPFTPDARKLYAVLSIMSYTIPFALVYWGQQFIPSGMSSVLFAGYPFWVAIFSQLNLPDEPLTAFKIGGIVLGFAGIVIIFFQDIHITDPNGFLGMLAVVVCSLLQGLSTVLIKKWGQPVSPFSLNLVGMSVGALLLLSLSFVAESPSQAVWDGAAIGSVLYLAIIGGVLAFVSYFWLLKRVEAVYLSLTSFINPIVAVILGALILNESYADSVYVGAGFVLTGILVANWPAIVARARATL